MEGSTTIVKCFLHISFEEQRERLLARLDDPTKRWKFNPADIDERELWQQYQETFREVLRRSSYDVAPWYVIPADRKWYRNWAVGRILVETLTEMAPEYPQPDLDIPDPQGPADGPPPPPRCEVARRLFRISNRTGRSDRSTMRPITGRRYLSISGIDSPRM